jgi:hypothetical protein
MKAQIRVRIFREHHNHLELEDGINEWIEADGLGPADILKVTQSESSDETGDSLTISVWYIPRSEAIKPIVIEGDEVPF